MKRRRRRHLRLLQRPTRLRTALRQVRLLKRQGTLQEAAAKPQMRRTEEETTGAESGRETEEVTAEETEAGKAAAGRRSGWRR